STARRSEHGSPGAVVGGWWEVKGDWHLAHECAQKQADSEGAWAHAYLHRVEGDLRNAGGWYGRAGRPVSTAPLKEEWETIARALLGNRWERSAVSAAGAVQL